MNTSSIVSKAVRYLAMGALVALIGETYVRHVRHPSIYTNIQAASLCQSVQGCLSISAPSWVFSASENRRIAVIKVKADRKVKNPQLLEQIEKGIDQIILAGGGRIAAWDWNSHRMELSHD